MFTTAIASTLALLAGSVLAQDNCGYAIVENACSYDVHLFNVPAEGGGQTQIQQVLGSNQTYQQQWTELSNGMGWSIKLSPTPELTNIMQYEYTYHGDGMIWWDLSDVNGNPWDGNWMVEATNSDSCHPKQQAYCYSTDDAYGMQACPAQAYIKVTLCSQAEAGNNACDTSSAAATSYVSAAPTSYSAPAQSSYAAATTSAVASSSIFTTASQSVPTWTPANTFYAVKTSSSEEAETPTSTYVSPTTFATSSTAVISAAPGVTVTEIDTDIVTDIVTATAYGKRHEHHPRHPHHRHV